MTKTIITIFITLYSLGRLLAIGAMYYLNTMRLPTAVVITTIICSLLCLTISTSCYLRHLSGKNLRFALFIGAGAACVNMLLILLAQPGTLTSWELLVTGTLFDPILFLGSCTFKIRDTKGMLGRTPFSRVVVQADRASKG